MNAPTAAALFVVSVLTAWVAWVVIGGLAEAGVTVDGVFSVIGHF